MSTRLALGLLVLLFVLPVRAEEVPGVTASEIRIGSCSALAGPTSFLGSQTVLGAKAYLDLVNARDGGVHGRKLRLIARDDGYEPDQTILCVNQLADRERVFALGFFVGTPTGAKAAPMAETKKVPLLGMFTGAEILRTPYRNYVIHVRASYYDETRAMVDALVAHGLKRVGVFYQDDAFGQAVLDGVVLALKKHGLAPISLGTYKRNTMDVEAGLESIRPSAPEAIVMVGTYAPLAKFVNLSRAAGLTSLILNVSFVGTEAFAKAAGKDGEGIIITQVVPPPSRTDLPAVALYRDALRRYAGGAEPSFVSLEGFVDAMVLVEALRRAGPALSRDGFMTALETIKDFDPGIGLSLGYGPGDRQGFETVYPTVLRNGSAVVIDQWSNVLPAPAARR